MSRIGKVPLTVPKTVKVNVATNQVQLEGPQGKLAIDIPSGIRVEFKEDQLKVLRGDDSKQSRSNHGTIRSRLNNMINGLVKAHRKELEIQGIGFRAQMQGKKVLFNLGLSHPIEFDIPTDLKVSVPTQTSIVIEGPDSVLVGQTAAKMRALKPVEPYKGKGIRYVGEHVRRKQGKSVTK